MNILILNTERGWGGIETHGIALASWLQRFGHKVTMACTAGSYVAEETKKRGIQIRLLRVANSSDIIAMAKMIRIIVKDRIDIMIVNRGREYWPATVVANLFRVKLIFFRHQMNALHPWTRYLVNHFVDTIVAVSNAVKERLIQCGVLASKIEVIYSLIDFDQFHQNSHDKSKIRQELGIANDAIVIGTAGKLNPGKGIFPLLHALRQVKNKQPNVLLLFIGEGSCRDQIQREAQQLYLENNVLITGFRNDMLRVYAALDIFVLPSICQEAFGMVLVEAMVMGKPVIGTTVGGIPEIIQHEKNGLLVPPQDADALTTAILRYIEDREFSQTLAKAALNTVLTIYSDKMLYQKLNLILE